MNNFLNIISVWVLPITITATVVFALIRKVKVFDSFAIGAKKGILTVYELLPTITALVVAVTAFKASGAAEILSNIFEPIANLFGVPKEIIPMEMISSVSGGGSLAIFESILKEYSPDSFIGRVASVVMGSTDTTLYAVTVYFSAVGIKKTRHTLYAGLCADFMSFVLSSLFVRLTIPT